MDSGDWEELLLTLDITVVNVLYKNRLYETIRWLLVCKLYFIHMASAAQGEQLSRLEENKTKGNVHFEKGEYLEAIECYTKCLRECEKAVIYTNRALCFLKLSKPRDALEDCEKALKMEPSNIKALYRKALANKALQRYSSSLWDLKAVLNLDPSNIATHKEYFTVVDMWKNAATIISTTTEKVTKPYARCLHPFRVVERDDNSEGLSDDEMDNSTAELQATEDCLEDEVDDGEVWEGVNVSEIEGRFSSFVAQMTTIFPTSIIGLHSCLNVNSNDFRRLVSCPKCHTLYEFEKCFVDKAKMIPKVCSFSKFPNHPHRSRRQHCGSQLLRAVVTKDGDHKFYPLKVYCYKIVANFA
ncbi:hypothetical protein EMCRGX_G020697 [Ephydatia muelleri]